MGLSASSQGSLGLGIFILAVGALMGVAAMFSLRSLWSKPSSQEDDLPRQGPIPPPGRGPTRSKNLGELKGVFPVLMSFDFGCLSLVSLVLIFLGLVLVFRAVGV